MAIVLTEKSKPADLFARVSLRFKKDGPIQKDTNGEEGYVELWHTDANACRASLENITAQLYSLNELKMRRNSDDRLTTEQAAQELKEIKELTREGIALRVKDWRLVNESGEVIDAEPTMENIRQVLDDPNHDLLGVLTEAVSKPENFTQTAT